MDIGDYTMAGFDEYYQNFMSGTPQQPAGANPTLGTYSGLSSVSSREPSTDFFSQDRAFGTQGSTGWLTGSAQVGSGLVSAYTGLESLNLAKKAFKTDKAFSEVNLANQAKTTNTALEDRQRSRLASQEGTKGADVYEGLDSYLARNRVSGTI